MYLCEWGGSHHYKDGLNIIFMFRCTRCSLLDCFNKPWTIFCLQPGVVELIGWTWLNLAREKGRTARVEDSSLASLMTLFTPRQDLPQCCFCSPVHKCCAGKVGLVMNLSEKQPSWAFSKPVCWLCLCNYTDKLWICHNLRSHKFRSHKGCGIWSISLSNQLLTAQL